MKLFSVIFLVSGCTFSLFAQQKQAKLVVGIVVDQMCYDYLYRFAPKLSDKGFLKLMNGGSVCENAQYNYVPTFTGPGHASIYTGATPSDHGIVANDWFNRSSKKTQNCVSDTTVRAVGSSSEDGWCSPKNLLATTITDQLKLASKQSKVISVSIKDRSAILPGGHLSDGSYWFDYETGKFITSSFYKTKLPLWVDAFNEQKKVHSYMQQSWKTLLPLEDYTESEADNSKYESLLPGKKTPEFPYDFKEMAKFGNPNELFTSSPFCNTFLMDFALAAMKNEQLGQDDITDFLAISFSTPDIVGHAFGPYSVEIEDIYLRLDLEMEKLIDVLEAQLGKDNFVLFVTADHAVVPVPQYLSDKKITAGYLYTDQLMLDLNADLKASYGFELIQSLTNNNIYLNRELIAKNPTLDALQIQNRIKMKLLENKAVKKIYTTEELMSSGSTDNWLKMVQKGYRYRESGDLILLLEAGYLPKSADVESSHRGTSHGSAFNYDTQIPLIWYGKDIKAQYIYHRIDITDITATLAALLHLQRPNYASGDVIEEIVK